MSNQNDTILENEAKDMEETNTHFISLLNKILNIPLEISGCIADDVPYEAQKTLIDAISNLDVMRLKEMLESSEAQCKILLNERNIAVKEYDTLTKEHEKLQKEHTDLLQDYDFLDKNYAIACVYRDIFQDDNVEVIVHKHQEE